MPFGAAAIAAAAALLYVAAAASFPWSKPGLQYDEALFLRDAVQLLRTRSVPTFVHEPGSWLPIGNRSIPLMDLPYAGATKGYATLIPFALFGTGAAVCRAVAILLTALGIGGIAWALCREISPGVGAAVGAILAVHPAILDQTLYDNSLVALWMATLGIAAAAMSWFMRTPSEPAALAFGAALGFAVWGRLNFLWLIGAAVISAAIFAPLLRSLVERATSLAVGFAVGSAPLLMYEAATRMGTLKFMLGPRPTTGIIARAGGRLPLLAETLLSDGEHRSLWGGPALPGWQIAFTVALATVGIAAALFAPRSGREEPRDVSWRRGSALAAALFAATMLTSRLQIAQHHLVTIVPVAALGIVLGVRRMATTRILRGAAFLAAALFAFLCGTWDVRSAAGIRRTGGLGTWSDAIESVAEVMRAEAPGVKARALTWGLANNVFVLTNGASAPRDSFIGSTEAVSELGRSWDEEIREGGWFLIGPSPSPASVGFRRALASAETNRRRRVFRQRDGAFYAELIEVPASPLPPWPSGNPRRTNRSAPGRPREMSGTRDRPGSSG